MDQSKQAAELMLKAYGTMRLTEFGRIIMGATSEIRRDCVLRAWGVSVSDAIAEGKMTFSDLSDVAEFGAGLLPKGVAAQAARIHREEVSRCLAGVEMDLEESLSDDADEMFMALARGDLKTASAAHALLLDWGVDSAREVFKRKGFESFNPSGAFEASLLAEIAQVIAEEA